MNNGKRIECFDFLRSYGCLAVVLLHVISAWKDDITYSSSFYNADYIRIFFNNGVVPILVRLAVPIFFMISGALFLSPQRSVSWKQIKSHIQKLLIILVLFGYPMALIELIVRNKNFDIMHLWMAFLNLLQADTWSHMWFLYAMIGLYLMTPILRAWIQKANKNEMKATIGIAVLLLSLIPTVNSFCNLKLTTFGIQTMGGALLCYLLGYSLYNTRWLYFVRKTEVYIAGFIGGCLTIAVGFFLRACTKSMLEPYHVWIVIYASVVFLVSVNVLEGRKINRSKIIQFLSNMSLTIYVIHPIFINGLYKGLHIFPDVLPSGIGELTVWAGVCLCSVIGAVVLKELPVFKTIL